MKKHVFRLAFSLSLATPTILSADAPDFLTDVNTVCQDNQCTLNDKNAVNQPLDTQTRGLAVPNRLIESDMNMFVNPGQVVNYGTAYLEGWLGGNLVWGGATVPLPAKQKLAIFLRRPLNTNSALGSTQGLFQKYGGATTGDSTFLTSAGTGYSGDYDGKSFGLLDASKKGFGNVDLMYGTALGSLNVGLRLSYANTTASIDKGNPGGTATRANYITRSDNIGAGLGVQVKDLLPGYLDFSVSGDLPISKLEYNNTFAAGSETLSVKSSGALGLSFLARYVTPVGQDKLIIAANVDTYNTPYEIRGVNLAAVQRSRDAAAKALNMFLDVAYHQSLQEGKLTVIYSAGVGSTSLTYKITDNINPATLDSEYKSTEFFIPLGVAVQHQTFETLKTRIGVRKKIAQSKTETDKTIAGTDTYGRSFYLDDELQLAMGLGWIPAEKVQLDFAMNANAFKLDTFFSAVSARYHY